MKHKLMHVGMLTLLLGASGVLKAHAADVKVQDTTGTVTFTAGTGGGTGVGGLNLDNTDIPTALNFGSAAISYSSETVLKATVDGNQSSQATKGNIKVTDERGTAAGWKVKVEQTSQFTDASKAKELTGAVLTMTTGGVSNVGGAAPSGGTQNQTVEFTPNVAVEMLSAQQNEGDGISELPINEFGLKIPGQAPKAAGDYTTGITWTVSDTI